MGIARHVFLQEHALLNREGRACFDMPFPANWAHFRAFGYLQAGSGSVFTEPELFAESCPQPVFFALGMRASALAVSLQRYTADSVSPERNNLCRWDHYFVAVGDAEIASYTGPRIKLRKAMIFAS